MTVLDERGLRAAREYRKAIAEREDDQDLRDAIDVYDRAVTPAERQAAASYLLIHASKADTNYAASINLAIMRCLGPELAESEGT